MMSMIVFSSSVCDDHVPSFFVVAFLFPLSFSSCVFVVERRPRSRSCRRRYSHCDNGEIWWPSSIDLSGPLDPSSDSNFRFRCDLEICFFCVSDRDDR